MRRFLVSVLLCLSGPALAQAPSGDALIRHCDGLLSQEQAERLAQRWVGAWNSTSIERVMAEYTENFEFRAGGILDNARISDPSGILHGHADNRRRWFAGTTKNSQNFRIVEVFAGVRSFSVFYINSRNQHVNEVMEVAPDCRIERANALYAPPRPAYGQPLVPPPPPVAAAPAQP
jgi:hypothetical protein